MNLTLIISSLSSGGAERVMTIIANYWAELQWNITLVTLDDGSSLPFYPLDPRIRHISLAIDGASSNSFEGLQNNIRRIKRLRQTIIETKPDAVISFIHRTNILTLLATHGLRVPVLVSEHITPGFKSIGIIWENLRRWLYPTADYVVVLTKQVSEIFQKRMRARIVVIPNPIIMPEMSNHSETTLRGPTIISLGRLDHQKGHDILLQAFSMVSAQFPDWSLTILGEGPMRAELEEQRKALGLENKVNLPGRTQFPGDFLKQSDLFVMASRFEGFPVALCEAMACGLPVISTTCCEGTREIVRNGFDGLLVEPNDADGLALAMTQLMLDPKERSRMGANAVEILDRYKLTSVMGMWEELLPRAEASH